MKPVGITRVRNESLIIKDTVEHFLEFCERIYLYDDCSEDNTVEIAKAAGRDRIEIVQGASWSINRLAEETRHRGLLLDMVKQAGFEWCLCFDADERLYGSLPGTPPDGVNGYRFRLFDGYMTPWFQLPYVTRPLVSINRMWGPEYRDILMLFRVEFSKYIGLDKREPCVSGTVQLADTKVKHYGKCLSVRHWEETCDYYASYFPEKYRRKWLARKGKAIHERSDFGRELFTWDDLMFNEDRWVKL